MRISTNNMQAVLHRLFGKTQEEVLKYFENTIARSYKAYFKSGNYPFGIQVTELEGDAVQVHIGFKGLIHLMSFRLQQYPACCGSRLFHHFSVNENYITQDQVDEIMKAFVYDNCYDRDDNERVYLGRDDIRYSSGALGGANRIEVVMVECRPVLDKLPDILDEITPVENPNINYKMLWNFFHKHSRRVRTRLEYNPNSGNVLHNMEVIF